MNIYTVLDTSCHQGLAQNKGALIRTPNKKEAFLVAKRHRNACVTVYNFYAGENGRIIGGYRNGKRYDY